MLKENSHMVSVKDHIIIIIIIHFKNTTHRSKLVQHSLQKIQTEGRPLQLFSHTLKHDSSRQKQMASCETVKP